MLFLQGKNVFIIYHYFIILQRHVIFVIARCIAMLGRGNGRNLVLNHIQGGGFFSCFWLLEKNAVLVDGHGSCTCTFGFETLG